MTDKQINRWLRRRFSPIGWLLLAYYGLMTALTTLTVFADMGKQFLEACLAGDFNSSVNWDAITGNAWGYLVSMLTGFVILHAWKGKGYWKREVFARENPMKGKTFLCFLLFCMGAQMINSLWITLLELLMNTMDRSVMTVLESVAGSTDTFSMFLYASIIAPIWEELLFRGFVLRTLQPFGKRFAVLCSALLFGLFHGNLLQTPYAVLMGLLLGYVTVEYSVVWSILLHMFNNLVLADLLTRLTATWSETANVALSVALFGGSALASLVILIKNRSKIREYCQNAWIDRRCLKCFFSNVGILLLTAGMCVSMAVMFFV